MLSLVCLHTFLQLRCACKYTHREEREKTRIIRQNQRDKECTHVAKYFFVCLVGLLPLLISIISQIEKIIGRNKN